MSHLVTENLVGRAVVAEELSLLGTQTHDVQKHLLVVIGIAVTATGRISLECSLALCPVFTCSHEERIAGNRDADLRSEGIVLSEKVIAELLGKCSKLRTDFLETCLLSFAESYAIVNESVVELLRNHILLTVEGCRISEDSSHSIEERLVHENLIRRCGHKWGNLIHDSLHCRCGI